jgi:glutamine synthetase
MGIVNKLQMEYIWLDGTPGTPQLRSKTKVVNFGRDIESYRAGELLEFATVWGFDGSSTQQAEGQNSDCLLMPVTVAVNPFVTNGLLVLCEVADSEGQPHQTNTRRAAVEALNDMEGMKPWAGMEQEWTLMQKGNPAAFEAWGSDIPPQGQYYCSVGEGNTFGRIYADEHLHLCILAGLDVVGLNAEVMPGQWEFQIGGPGVDPVSTADQLWLARYILHRSLEGTYLEASFDPKPAEGDWNGAGCHTNFSTKAMREAGGITEINRTVKMMGTPENMAAMVAVLGAGFEERLTGAHETCSYKKFKSGVGDRTASVRIPLNVARAERGYFEDRRPNANCDPYRVVSALMTIATQES